MGVINVTPERTPITICRGDSVELDFNFPSLDLTGFTVSGAIGTVGTFTITEVDFSVGHFVATFDNTDTDIPAGEYPWKIVAELGDETWTLFGGPLNVKPDRFWV